MLTSLGYIFLSGLILGVIFDRLKLPRLLGMLIAGILLGPSALNLLDSSILGISADLRQLALVIILTRAGLSLDLNDLKRVGRPALLMCFLPACFEIVGILVLAPPLLGISLLDAAIIGTVVAAVSPAVVVPRMLRLMEAGYGTNKKIPQLILMGASVDDVFVIVLFTAFTTMAAGGAVTGGNFVQVPVSILTGILLGSVIGILFRLLFQRFHMRDTVKVVILLSTSFFLVALEHRLAGILPLSGLLAIMSIGILLRKQYPVLADRLSQKYNKLWVAAELVLFVLVGAAVDLQYAVAAGLGVVALILGALVFRGVGVLCCLIKTGFTSKEKLFCVFAYLPKATVQAAIGSAPLAMGLACGNMALTVAVVAILITAPLGAILVDKTYRKLLTQEK